MYILDYSDKKFEFHVISNCNLSGWWIWKSLVYLRKKKSRRGFLEKRSAIHKFALLQKLQSVEYISWRFRRICTKFFLKTPLDDCLCNLDSYTRDRFYDLRTFSEQFLLFKKVFPFIQLLLMQELEKHQNKVDPKAVSRGFI